MEEPDFFPDRASDHLGRFGTICVLLTIAGLLCYPVIMLVRVFTGSVGDDGDPLSVIFLTFFALLLAWGMRASYRDTRLLEKNAIPAHGYVVGHGTEDEDTIEIVVRITAGDLAPFTVKTKERGGPKQWPIGARVDARVDKVDNLFTVDRLIEPA